MTTTTTTEVRGLVLDVFRAADGPDFTLGGVSARHDRLTLVGFVDTTHPSAGRSVIQPADWRVRPVREDAPPVVAVIGRIGARYAYLEPVDIEDGRVRYRAGRWSCFGGNFAGSNGGRFGGVLADLLGYPEPHVLPVHDRYER
ncbi:hypothetical protein IU414_27265 [Nocardia farcinica]|uniref:hypothetical protein n=1 Tax=Nocardia TaxID=1817 RepID=UPI0003169C07|nr:MULTISPECIES: hypothetical protein [Nocardia]MBF6588447.1 hypothetical protein [Nocardia farcinica]